MIIVNFECEACGKIISRKETEEEEDFLFLLPPEWWRLGHPADFEGFDVPYLICDDCFIKIEMELGLKKRE